MQRRRTRALRTAECHVFHADQSVACSIRDIMAARRWMRTSLLCSPTPGRDVCARGVDQRGARRGVWLGGELSTGTRRRAQRRVRCEARRRRSWRDGPYDCRTAPLTSAPTPARRGPAAAAGRRARSCYCGRGRSSRRRRARPRRRRRPRPSCCRNRNRSVHRARARCCCGRGPCWSRGAAPPGAGGPRSWSVPSSR